jgi:hypothetical protein
MGPIGRLRAISIGMAMLGLIAAGCQSSAGTKDIFAEPATAETESPKPSDNDASTEPGQTAQTVTRPSGTTATIEPIDLATVDLGEWTMTPADAEDALAFYADYLALSDAARLGDASAAAELDIVTDPLVRYLTDDWQSRNEQLAQENLAIIDLSSSPNVLAVTGSEEGAVVHDCVVQQVTDEFTQATRTEYVEQITVLRKTSGLWLASLVEVLHDGTLGSGPVRCVSNAERQETEAAVREALDGLAEAWADPVSGVDHLSEHLGQELFNTIEGEIVRMAGEGEYADGDQTHTVRVVGAQLSGQAPSYLVATCTTFPDGLTRRAIGTGEPLTDGPATAPVLGELYREWTVAIETGPAGDRLVLNTLDLQRVDHPCDQENQT